MNFFNHKFEMSKGGFVETSDEVRYLLLGE